MSWWLRDKITYAMELAIGLILGYVITSGVAVYRTQRSSNQPSFRAFVRQHGFDTSMLALVAIPAAALAGLVYGGLSLILLDVVFGVRFDRVHRWQFVGAAAGATYIGFLVYITASLAKDTRKH